MTCETVVVLGASNNPDRYSNMAVKRLLRAGHRVIPVNPHEDCVEGLQSFKSLGEIGQEIDTITVYVNPRIVSEHICEIVAAKPKRVILNPGTESPLLVKALKEANIPYMEACTLVLLSTGMY